ncbi:MAG: hypothetical protein FJ010_01330 [Chloroflexi bacterium]|nr:hypothetical protein [Chloroflexota bacterium]
MALEIILHVMNQDPIIAEIEELPQPDDLMIKVTNPRYRDGRELHFLDHGVNTVIWPVNQLTFIEILPSEAEERIIGLVRE